MSRKEVRVDKSAAANFVMERHNLVKPLT